MIEAMKDYLRVFGAKSALFALAMAAASLANDGVLKPAGHHEAWRELARKLRELAETVPASL